MPNQFDSDIVDGENGIINKSKRSIFFAFILSIFIGMQAISLLENWINQIYFSIKYEELPYGTLFYGDSLSLNLLKILFISAGVFLASFIFSYLHKKSRYLTNFLLGFLTTYLFSLILISLMVYISISEGFDWGVYFFSFSSVEADFYITLSILQLLSIGVFSRIGQIFGKEIKRFDAKDERQDTVFGIKKLTLFFLSFPLVAYLNIGFTVIYRLIYASLLEIFSRDFWDRFLSWETLWGSNRMELVFPFFLPFFGVMIILLLFKIFEYGIQVVKDKEQKYRIYKLIGIFIILPIVISFFFPEFTKFTVYYAWFYLSSF